MPADSKQKLCYAWPAASSELPQFKSCPSPIFPFRQWEVGQTYRSTPHRQRKLIFNFFSTFVYGAVGLSRGVIVAYSSIFRALYKCACTQTRSLINAYHTSIGSKLLSDFSLRLILQSSWQNKLINIPLALWYLSEPDYIYFHVFVYFNPSVLHSHHLGYIRVASYVDWSIWTPLALTIALRWKREWRWKY